MDQEITVKILILARSRQKWGGFYGPRFKKQFATIVSYDKERHWIGKVPIKELEMGQPYHSFCNTAVGNTFYY